MSIVHELFVYLIFYQIRKSHFYIPYLTVQGFNSIILITVALFHYILPIAIISKCVVKLGCTGVKIPE